MVGLHAEEAGRGKAAFDILRLIFGAEVEITAGEGEVLEGALR